MAVLGLRFCARAFSSCGKWGPLLIAVRGPLTIAASFAAEHRLQARRLSNCGSRAQPLCGTWDLPGPGPEPVSPALAGGLPTTAPPGKPLIYFLILLVFMFAYQTILFARSVLLLDTCELYVSPSWVATPLSHTLFSIDLACLYLLCAPCGGFLPYNLCPGCPHASLGLAYLFYSHLYWHLLKNDSLDIVLTFILS